MALTPAIIPPLYPNVPNTIGVPPLIRSASYIQNLAALLLADGASVYQIFSQTPQWGIFLDGVPAITADTVLGFDFNGDYRISSAPQEAGAFVSYNKVQDPFDGRVTFLTGGSVAARTNFIQQIETAVASLSTGYSLVMPEFTWPSINVVKRSFRRTRETGSSCIEIDVWVEQVRVTGTSQFSSTNTVNPTSSNPVSSGQVQPAAPTSAQSTAITPST